MSKAIEGLRTSRGTRATTGLARLVAGSALLCAMAVHAAAPAVSYRALDLADTTAGQDLWQIDFTVTGGLALFESVNILFDAASYAGIGVLGGDARLSIQAIDPLPALPADGSLTLTATEAVPSPVFASAQVVWSGTGTPGSQAFEVLDDQFNVTATGMTSAVPEPSAWLLWALGAVAACTARACRRHAGHGAASSVG